MRPAQWPRMYLIASTRLDRVGSSARAVINLVFSAIQDRLRRGLPDGTPLGGTAPPDPRLDRINLAQAGDDVARKRGVGGLVDGDKLAAGMDHPNTIHGLHFTVGIPFAGACHASPRRRRRRRRAPQVG